MSCLDCPSTAYRILVKIRLAKCRPYSICIGCIYAIIITFIAQKQKIQSIQLKTCLLSKSIVIAKQKYKQLFFYSFTALTISRHNNYLSLST